MRIRKKIIYRRERGVRRESFNLLNSATSAYSAVKYNVKGFWAEERWSYVHRSL